MNNHTKNNKKLLCYTAFVSLLYTSLSPLSAMITEKDLFSQEEAKAIKVNAQSLESSKSETQSSHLSNRHSKRALGDEFVINQNTTVFHHNPSVADLTNGNVFVTWDVQPPIGAGYIYGRVFDPNGTPVTNELYISQNTTASQLDPSVVGLTNGNVFVAWAGAQTGWYDSYGRVFSPTGTPVTNEFTINQVTTKNQQNPSATGLTNGNVFVAWVGTQTGNSDIYGRVFSPTATPVTNEFSINQGTGGFQFRPSVASLTNGNVFVVWYGDQTGKYDSYGRVFSPTGTPVTNEFTINQVTTGNQDATSVVSLTNGNVFVVWYGDQTGNTDSYGRVFSPTGTPVTNEFTINQVTTGNQDATSVVSLTNGNVFVVWYGDQTGNTDSYGRVFSPTGTPVTNEFSVNQGTTGNQQNPSIASLTNGNVLVTWEGSNNDIHGRIISAQGLTPSPTESPTVPIDPTAAPTNSANRPTPLLLIPAKVVMDGSKILWNFATTKTWKSVDSIEDAAREERPAALQFSRTIGTPQKVVNYVKSWFSSESWSEYFDSMEKSVLDYSKRVVEETPSYQNTYFGKSTLKENNPLVCNGSYNSNIGAGFLPYSVISGTIGQ
jgi:hypothetical protein